jgi:threonyl-tRNA synthetase
MLQRIYGTAWAQEGRPGRLSAHAGGSGEARSPQARQAARPVPSAGRSAGHGVLASQGLGDLAAGRAVHAPRLQATVGYQEVKGARSWTARLWEKSGHWENYPRKHVHDGVGESHYAIKPMNCPGHMQMLTVGCAAIASCRCATANSANVTATSRRAPARHHARARLYPGRRPYLLHRRPDPRRVRGLHGAAAARLQADFGFSDIDYKVATRPAQAGRLRRNLG